MYLTVYFCIYGAVYPPKGPMNLNKVNAVCKFIPINLKKKKAFSPS